MPDTPDGHWYAGNGWGIQIYTRGPKTSYWRHATDRCQYYSRQMAQCFADGLKAAEYDKPYRLIDPKGNQILKWGPPVEDEGS